MRIADLAGIVAPFDVALVVLFGSHARGSPRPDSDIDLGVLHRKGRRLRHRELAALQVALAGWSGGKADVVDLATSDAVFRYEIVSEGRPFYETESGAWAAFVARALIDHDDVAPLV